jgi:hypothetical protein
MLRILSSFLVVCIWLSAGHHCFIEQMVAHSEFPQTPVKECDSHKPADPGSHNEGEYCGTAGLASLAKFGKLGGATELGSFLPILALVAHLSFDDSSLQPLLSLRASEFRMVYGLVSSLAAAPNAPPLLFS